VGGAAISLHHPAGRTQSGPSCQVLLTQVLTGTVVMASGGGGKGAKRPNATARQLRGASETLLKRHHFLTSHQTISNARMVGSGSTPPTGEISPAHHGVA
jgi:hypothetical protein